VADITIEGRRHLLIRCGRCSAPMLAQNEGNTEDNQDLEVCPACTRAIYIDATGEVWG
jgi:hypothetical protein